MKQKIIISNMESIKPKHQHIHQSYEYLKYEFTPRNNNNKCYVALYEIPPLKANYPYHYHMNNTEVFYIISGEGVLISPDGETKIKKGDVIVCPPGELGAHKIVNTSETENLTYFDCDTVTDADVAFYPDSDKIGVILNGISSTFYDKSDNIDYYKGE